MLPIERHALSHRQLFAALEKHYGEREARSIWMSNYDLQAPRWQAREKLDHALRGMEYADRRLIFEYYAMEEPSKEGLAKALANKNAALHQEWREWKTAQNRWVEENREGLRRYDELAELYHRTGRRPMALPSLPPEPQRPSGLFGSRGTTDWQTMHHQIKRVFRKYAEACAAVGEAPIEIREEEHLKVEGHCRADTEMQMRGRKPKRIFTGGTKRRR
jgi:hypothetical protein